MRNNAIGGGVLIIKAGYYPILDMVLAIRQIDCTERFQPFPARMEFMSNQLPGEIKETIYNFGELTHEWLDVIESIIGIIEKGASTPEEIILGIIKSSDSFVEQLSGEENVQLSSFMKKLWQDYFCSAVSQYGRVMFDKSMQIADGVDEKGIIEYLTGTSDRVAKVNENTIKYLIIPEHYIDLDRVNSIILMPSLFACRKLTFWYSGSNYVFYISAENQENSEEEPSDMLLLTASALNDRTRLKMLRLLYGRNYSTTHLSDMLGINSSTVSRHFKLLKDANFVDIFSQQGNSIYYSLKMEEVKKSMENLTKYIKGEK